MNNKTVYNKLVRDLIPEIIENSGKRYKAHTANDGDFKAALNMKLSEEVNEFLENPCEEEIADILEVIEALMDCYGFKNVESIKNDKQNKRGGFKNRTILECVYD